MGHKKIIEKIRLEGFTIKDIGFAMGVSPMSIYRWKKSKKISDRRLKNLTELLTSIETKKISRDIDFKYDTKGLEIECDFCFSKSVLILYPKEDRATDLRFCKKHIQELQRVLNIII